MRHNTHSMPHMRSFLLDRATQYVQLTRLHRPVGIFLLLWPTLWALWLAGEGKPDQVVLLVFVLGVVLMRSAGCVINDFADRELDPLVSRTRDRPISAGRVSSREALILFGVLCLAAFGLVLLMNRLTILMSLGAVALAATYPFVKRYTHLPQVYLGAAFGWAIPMAFAAQTGAVPKVAWLLFTTTVLWAVAYDTMYAMVDREDDLKAGARSTAILFGDLDRVIIAGVQLAVLAGLLMVGANAQLGAYYYGGVAVGACLFVYQQFLIRTRQPQRCFQAFINNQWFGAIVFAGLYVDYLLA